MHGPQALASTVPSMSFSDCIWPSRSIVARTCSEPGVTKNGDGRLEPVRLRLLGDVGGAAHILVGGIGAAADQRGRDLVDKPILRVGDLGGELGDRSRPVGRMRADDVGFELGQVELDHAVVVFRRIGLDLLVGLEQMLILLEQRHQDRACPVARRYLAMCSSAGNIEVVAPSSAPILVIVALPVALIVRAPGPIYSTIALVPPETVSCPAT